MLSAIPSDNKRTVKPKERWRKFFPRLRLVPLLFATGILYFAIASVFQGKAEEFAFKETVKIFENIFDIKVTYQQAGFFSKPSVWIKDLHVYNDREELLLSCPYAEINFSFFDIINKRQVKSVFSDGLFLQFTHSESGVLNWNLDPKPQDGKPPGDISFPRISAERIFVSNGRLIYDAKEISDISVDAVLLSYPEGINITVEKAAFSTCYVSSQIFLKSDVVLYPDLRLSGLVEIGTGNTFVVARADVFSREARFSAVIDTFWSDVSEWRKEISGRITGKGSFTYHEGLKYADFNLFAEGLSFDKYFADSISSEISYEDEMISTDNSRIYLGGGEMLLNCSYAPKTDSMSFQSEFQGIRSLDIGFLSGFSPNHFTANGTAAGWIKELKNPDSLVCEAVFSFANSSVNDVSLNSLYGTLNAGAGHYALSIACVTGEYGNLGAQIDFSKNGYDLSCRLQDFNVSLLSQLKITDRQIRGRLNGVLTYDGKFLNADVTAEDAEFNGFYCRFIDMEFENFEATKFTADAVRISGRGLVYNKFTAETFALFAETTDDLLEGKVSLSSEFFDAGSFFAFDAENSNILFENLTINSDSFFLLTTSPLIVSFADNRLSLDTFYAEGYSGLNFSASCEINGDNISGFLNADSVSMNLNPFFPSLPPIHGYLNLRSGFSGPLSDPRAHVLIRTGKVKSGLLFLDFAHLEGETTLRGLKIDTCELVFQNRTSTISGYLPFGTEDEIDLKILFDDIGLWPLEFLSDIAVMLSGNVRGNASIKGTYKDPDIYGQVELVEGAAFIKPAGQIAQNISAKADFHDDSINFSVAGTNSRGHFGVEGDLVMTEGYRSFNSRIKIDFKDVDYTGFEGVWANVTGNLEIQVDSNFHSSIRGDAFINQALISPVSETQSQPAANQEIPDMEIFIDGSSGNIIFRHEMAEVELSGTYNVSSFDGLISTKGELIAERGSIFYLDRSFRITEGQLLLITDSTQIDGEIDFYGKTEIYYSDPANGTSPESREVTIIARLSGNINSPSLTLTSEPKMSEQDIISLLTFNTTWSNITSISTIASAVPNRAVNYLLRTKVFSRLERALNLSVINLETQLGSSNSAKLTLAKYVTRDVYVEYKKDILNNTPADITLTYRIWKNTSFILNKDSDDIMGAGLQWIWRY